METIEGINILAPDTNQSLGLHSKYQVAEQITTQSIPSTSEASSKRITISSSSTQGSISVRTIPIVSKILADDPSTT